MQVPKGMEKYGLVPPTVPVSRRLVVLVEGDTGTGKTDFILRTAPRMLDPVTGARGILYINLDQNGEGVEERYINDDVLIKNILVPPEFTRGNKVDQARDRRIVDEFEELVMAAIRGHVFRTVAVDTLAPLYELARRGILGGGLEFGDVPRKDFAPVNTWMKSFFDAAKKERVNFIVTAHQKDEYKGASATGNKVMRGWKQAPECAQIHVLLKKDNKYKASDEDPQAIGKFSLVVMKCTAASWLEGQEFVGADISFPMLGCSVFPATQDSPEVWL